MYVNSRTKERINLLLNQIWETRNRKWSIYFNCSYPLCSSSAERNSNVLKSNLGNETNIYVVAAYAMPTFTRLQNSVLTRENLMSLSNSLSKEHQLMQCCRKLLCTSLFKAYLARATFHSVRLLSQLSLELNSTGKKLLVNLCCETQSG